MAYSKVWLSLTPEEQKLKRKEYRERFKALHPDRVKANKDAYKERHKERLAKDTAKRQKTRMRSNKLKAIEYKGGVCFDCKNEYPPCCYDFHHLNPDEKDFNIAKINGRSFENIKDELDKCVLLCSNCHRIRHTKE
jgi:hypothetical protein